MIIKIKTLFKAIIAIALISMILVGLNGFLGASSAKTFLGGELIAKKSCNADHLSAINSDQLFDDQRFHRPSAKKVITNEFDYNYYLTNGNYKFNNGKDLIVSFFSVLREASNMDGYSGGCGSVGEGIPPYELAYNLLSDDKKNEMTLEKFTGAFEGIGHISLLEIHSMPEAVTQEETKERYFIEIEVITGKKIIEQSADAQASLFAYYYGAVDVKEIDGGIKIDQIKYFAEDFLCAPYHGWDFDATMAVDIIYKENLGIIDEISNVEQKDSVIQVYAKSGDKNYRFDFIRLTNGYDILIDEKERDEGMWRSVELLTGDWKRFKLTL